MNKLVKIEHQKQRVLLTSQLAEGYRTDIKNIQMNFSNHKQRFEEGKHYHRLTGEVLKCFLQVNDIGLQNPSKVRTLFLWTEKGALRHAKILDTDKAWEVYEQLEDTYFKVGQAQLPMTPEEMIIMQAQSIQEFKQDVDHRFNIMDQKVDNQITLDHGMQRKVQKAVGKRVIDLLGKDTEEYKRYSKKYFAALYRDIKDRMGIPSYKDVKKKDYEAVKNYIQYWMPPADIKETA